LQTARVALIALVSSLALHGALFAGDRFYPGEPLPQSEVALVLLHYKCSLGSLTVEGKPAMPLLAKMQLELMPGQYHLCVGYAYIGAYSTANSKGCVDLPLKAEAGHTYYIYPDFPRPNTWQPTVVDLPQDADLKAAKDGEKTKKRAQKYFEGNRRPATDSGRGYWD
jgi:hypothetical protein